MLSYPGNKFTAGLGLLIIFAFIVSVIRASLQFVQGFEQGFGFRQKSDLQTIFSKDHEQ